MSSFRRSAFTRLHPLDRRDTSPPAATDVLIVGAGVGGLAAARLLVEGGLHVLVVEARDRVGGRLLSVPVGRTALDLGATWFWANEPRIQAMIDELDLEIHPQHIRGDALYQDPTGVHRLDGNPIDGPAGRLVRGMQALAQGVAEALPEDAVRLSQTVTEIRSAEGGLEIGGTFGTMMVPQVILAIPPALAVRTLRLDPALPEPLASLAARTPVWMGAITKVVVRYPAPFWRDAGLAGAAVSHVGPIRELHDMSGPEGRPAALFGFVPAVVPGAPGVTREAVVRQLETLFGPEAADPTDVIIMDWRSEPFTSPDGADRLHAWDETYGHPLYQTPTMNGRLHWASTETARDAPGHVEGALSAGARAAAAVLEARRSRTS